jgi:hypothetical protein
MLFCGPLVYWPIFLYWPYTIFFLFFVNFFADFKNMHFYYLILSNFWYLFFGSGLFRRWSFRRGLFRRRSFCRTNFVAGYFVTGQFVAVHLSSILQLSKKFNNGIHKFTSFTVRDEITRNLYQDIGQSITKFEIKKNTYIWSPATMAKNGH